MMMVMMLMMIMSMDNEQWTMDIVAIKIDFFFCIAQIPHQLAFVFVLVSLTSLVGCLLFPESAAERNNQIWIWIGLGLHFVRLS